MAVNLACNPFALLSIKESQIGCYIIICQVDIWIIVDPPLFQSQKKDKPCQCDIWSRAIVSWNYWLQFFFISSRKKLLKSEQTLTWKTGKMFNFGCQIEVCQILESDQLYEYSIEWLIYILSNWGRQNFITIEEKVRQILYTKVIIVWGSDLLLLIRCIASSREWDFRWVINPMRLKPT